MAILAAIAEPTGQPLRILIADDHEIIRNAVRSILEKVPRFQLAGEACDGAEAIEKALQLRPDVVILNISMPILNGLDAARQLTARLPGTAVVILSSNADQHFVDLARKSGARAYVSKSKAVASLVSAIEASVRGDDFVLVD